MTRAHRDERTAFPGFDRLYSIFSGGSTVAFVGRINLTLEEALAILRGSRADSSASISVAWAMGRSVPGDFIWTTLAIPFVVNSKVVSVLQSEDASGWSPHGVTVTGKQGQDIPGYSYLSITGRCGPILWEQSTEIQKQYPGGVFPAYRGYYFDPATWDGSDVFMSSDEKAALRFWTARIRNALMRARISNVRFERLDLSERDAPR